MRTVLKTVAIIAAITTLFFVIIAFQLETGLGSAGSMRHATGGSPEWFEAAASLVAIATYIIWPLLIVAGVGLHHWWCRDSPLWMAAFIATPAVVLNFGTSMSSKLTSAGYVALAVAMATALRHYSVGRHDTTSHIIPR